MNVQLLFYYISMWGFTNVDTGSFNFCITLKCSLSFFFFILKLLLNIYCLYIKYIRQS